MNTRILYFTILAAFLSSAFGAGEIRFAHEVPDAPAVDVYLNGNLMWRAVSFRDVTYYAQFPGTSAEIKVNLAGTSTSLFTVNVIPQNGPVTVAAVNPLASITYSIFKDYSSRSTPSQGRSIVRVVHVAPGTPAVDVYFQANSASPLQLFDTNLTYLSTSGYQETNSGCYNVIIKETGVTASTGVNLGQVCLNSQQVYSIFVNGLAQSTTPGRALGATLVLDVYAM